MTMLEHTFAELVDIQKLQKSMDYFYQAFGLPSAVVDPDEKVLVAAGWIDICTKFHRTNPLTSERCRESDAYIKTHLHEGDYVTYRCRNGLSETAFPLVIGGMHIATFFFGQFFFDDQLLDEDYFRKQAEDAGFDVESYLEAYRQIPKFSRNEIDSIVAYYKVIADIMIDIGTNNLRLLREIDERKLVEKSLRDTYDIITKSPAVAIKWKNEKNWPLAFVSDNVERLTEYKAEAFKSGSITYIQIVHPEDTEQIRAEVAKNSEDPSISRFSHQPYRIITKSGKIKWLDDITDIQRNSDGEITHYQGIIIDITDRVLLEEQLRQSQKIESIGRLAGGIAHDFNNILTAIIGNVELIMMDMDSESGFFSEIQEIKDCAHRAADLTRQLLAFSRRQIIEPKVLDLNKTIRDFEKMLIRLIGEDIEYTTKLTEDIWPVKVDVGQIEQVITNLAVNARDAMPQGGKLLIETANVHLNGEDISSQGISISGDYVMLAVSDNGVGIPTSVKSKIFDPFFTTKEKGKGTGLGLSTCFGIVKQNNGHISVYSEPGFGTTIKIYLQSTEKTSTISGENEAPADTISGHETILLAEDEKTVRDMITKILTKSGYTVIEAQNGADALETAKNYPGRIDLLITDVIMPQTGGRELANNISEICSGIKILFISGYTDDAIVHHGILEEGINFLQKPFSKHSLLKKIADVFSN